MLLNEELGLLIKSKYPLIYLESIDEEYCIRQLRQIASQQNLVFYAWSATTGLQRDGGSGTFYQTREPVGMLRLLPDVIRPNDEPALLVLKDMHKYLDDSFVLRLTRDLLNQIRNTKTTMVILAAEFKLPKDIENDTAHIIGGYPDEKEIASILQETTTELLKHNKQIKISLDPTEKDKMVRSLKGLSIQQIRNIISQCIIDNNTLSISDLSVIEGAKKKIYDQEGFFEFCVSEQEDHIAGFDNLKRWVQERRDSFNNGGPANLPPPKGVLLMGVQGCGKSLAIKVIAREFSLPLYRLDLGRLYSKYIGETEQNLQKALLTTAKLSPLCLWLDEIEKLFAASAGDVDGGVSQRVLATFLTWMQERQSNCFIAATANNIYRLPPEFLRKGRFDEIFFVDLPDAANRLVLFNIHLKKRGLDPARFDINKLAAAATDFNGAEIEQAIIAALYRASMEKQETSTQHILEQIQTTKPLSVLKAEDITALREWAKDRTVPA